MRYLLATAVLALGFLLASSIGNDALAYSEACEGSWYGPGFYGNLTASGAVYTGAAGTAAHPWLPFGSRVLVEGPYGSAVLVITDRGPYVWGRCIDVSAGSSWLVGGAVVPVRVTAL